MANVISAGNGANKHYLHSGFSATIDDSYSSPDGTPQGITWDGTNVISAGRGADKHYLHSGFSSTIDDSYSSPGISPRGITWDGTNVLSADTGTDKHYLHSGFSATIDDSYSAVGRGMSWDGTNVLSDNDSDKHLLHSGFSATIDDSYTAPSTQPTGMGWGDGTNVLSADSVADKHYLHSGFSSTIDDSYSSPDGNPGGMTWDGRFAATSAVTGTITPSSTEAQIVSGGRTIIITLTDDTWVAAGGTFDGIRQDIIDGLDSAQSELTGWNAEVRDKQLVAGVVRTSPTVVTITLDAQVAYNITDTETITVTVPASALALSVSPVVSTPTFAVTEIPVAVVTGTAEPTSTEAQIVSGGRTIIITLADDEWVAAGGTFDGIRQDIIDGLDSAQSELTGWNAEVRDKQLVAGVVRTSPTVVTITLDAQVAYNITDTETITVTVPASALDQTALPITATPTFTVTEIPTAVVTGTIGPSSTEAQIIAGGRTIIITLTDDTWVAAGGTFDGIRQDIIDGLDSAQSELTGWNAEVRDKQLVAGVVRTSPTVVTITLDAQAAYDITAPELITVTVPASALDQTALPITATPNFAISQIPVAVVTGDITPSVNESLIVAGGRTIIITLMDDIWVALGGTFDAVRQDIIDGLDSAQVEATGWNAEVRDKEVVTAVVRTSDTIVTITLTAQAAYDITASELITVTVPASALDATTSPITAIPPFAVTFTVPIPGPTDPDPFESIAGNGLGGVSRNHTPPGVIVNY